jgi:hypothetical protein
MTAATTPPTSAPEPAPTPSPATVQWVQLLERTLWSALESLAGIYLTKGGITISAAEIVILTALTALITAVKTYLLAKIDVEKQKTLEWLEDTVARTAFTFGETLLASLITAAVTPLNLASLKAAVIAAAAAALAGVKSSIAKSFGNANSAATLPASLEPQPSAAS